MLSRLTKGGWAAAADPVSRGWAIVGAGSVARLAIGFLASVIIARGLGPAELGTYALLGVTAGLAGALGELGLTESAVRRLARSWDQDREAETVASQAAAFVWLRALGSLLLVAALLVSLPWTAHRLPGHDPWLLALALLGVVAAALSGAVSAVLQAGGRFARLSTVMITNAALTVLLAAGLRLAGLLNLTTALLVLGAGTSLACFLLGRRLLPGGIRLGWPGLATLRRESRALLRFGSWVWIANNLALLAAQLDLILAGHWLAPAALGDYALASNLSAKADVVNQSLHAALLPAASALDSPARVAAYLRRGFVRGGLAALLLAAATPLAPRLIPLLFGEAYKQAGVLFVALLGVALFDLLIAPVLLLCYSVDRPRLLAASDALRVATLAAAALWLVPAHGVYGLIGARLLARLAGAALTLTGLLRGRDGYLREGARLALAPGRER